jgi:hypothetical protein
MGFAIVQDFSELITFFGIIYLTFSTRSDDIVEAAWESGVGIHALIWVSTFRKMQFL